MKKKKTLFIVLLVALFVFSILPLRAEATTAKKRALLIGNQNYINPKTKDLSGPKNDVQKIELMLLEQRETYQMESRINLTKEEMVEAIRTAFRDSKEGDFNVLFYAGHGAYDNLKNSSFLVGIDDEKLYAEELEEILRNIPGTFWILLDACNSGGFIDNDTIQSTSLKNDEPIWTALDEDEDLPQGDDDDTPDDFFSDAFVSPFSYASRAGISGDKYFIMASAHKEELSWERNYGQNWGWGGEFTRAISLGNGYQSVFRADKDKDNRVLYDELLPFVRASVKRSRVAAYPAFSDREMGSAKLTEDPKAPVRHNIPAKKTWNIRFSEAVKAASAKEKIQVSDWLGTAVPISVSESGDKSVIQVRPVSLYNENSYYKLTIENGIEAESGEKTLKNTVILHFFTGKDLRRDEALALVKNGHLEGHPNKTVGEAFAKEVEVNGKMQPFFQKGTWTYRQDAETKEDLVEFTGDVKMSEKPVTLRALFTVDLDKDAFVLSFIGIGNQPLTEDQKNQLFEILYN